MIVVDASAGLSALLAAGPARVALSSQQLRAPPLIDAEIASVLRRRVGSGSMSPAAGGTALDTWRRLGLTRHPVVGVLGRIWQLRENLSSYGASYVALAEALDCTLITADGRLSRAAGLRCPITVVPR